jgi:hypothetical protein
LTAGRDQARFSELRKLTDTGLLSTTWHSNQKLYRANPDSPIVEELRSLMRKSVVLADRQLKLQLESGHFPLDH